MKCEFKQISLLLGKRKRTAGPFNINKKLIGSQTQQDTFSFKLES
jgi:hypothetical protein